MPTLAVATRVRLENILFATDFSTCSDAALPYATAIARRYHSTLYIVNVVPPLPHDFIPPDPTPAAHISTDKMRLFVSTDLLQGIAHKEYVEHGAIAEVLHELVEKWKIDLIVLGAHGRKGIQKVLLGSVAEDIFRHAPCPVMTIGPHVIHRIGPEDLRHILYATDFGEEAGRGLPYALSLAEEHHAKFTLLHAAPAEPEALQLWDALPAIEKAEAQVRAQAELRRLIPEDAALVTHPDYQIEFGDPAVTIVKSANRIDADVIVMGVKRPMPLSTHLHSGTAYKVLCEARCPVLTVGHEFHG